MKIVFVGIGGVPFSRRAIDVRLGSFAELFNRNGYEVEIVNRYSSIKCDRNFTYPVYEPFRKITASNLIMRLIFYLVALVIEPLYLLRSHRRKKIDILFTTTGHFGDFIFYKIISWFIGAKLVNQYCEARSSFEESGLYHRVNGYLVDNISPKLWDGAVCISHYLEDTCVKSNKKLVTTIVYPICDFSAFDDCIVNTHNKYILFCGSIGYNETINFILDSYRKSALHGKTPLIMVLSGNKCELDLFKANNTDILVETNLPYSNLIEKYKEAAALLIPLRNNVRDIARFPNKTCEYSAAGGLIITTNVGEMQYVFKDKVNALVADNYTIDEYVEKLNWLNDNLIYCDIIKKECYKTGLQYFSIESYLEKVDLFFNKIRES